MLIASSASAFTYQPFAHDGKKRAIWVPASDRGLLVFDDDASMTINLDSWKLEGGLTSTDGSHWVMTIDFSDLLSGPQFGVLTSMSNGEIGSGYDMNMEEPKNEWGFAGTIQGTLTALDGELAGQIYSLARHPRPADFRAEFGNCPVDIDCDKHLSTWIDITDKGNGVIGASNPVPEPSAALVFGLGTVLVSSSIRRRQR
jgi:hypothetical protein